jgi:rhamnose transport system permease protein
MTKIEHPTASVSRLIGLWEVQLVFLLLIVAAACSLLSPHFLDALNLLNMTTDFTEKGLMALPMAFTIISGAIDLSVASNAAMSATTMAVLFRAGLPLGLDLGAGLAVGLIGGLVNGLLVGKVRLPPLVATLGTYALYRGISASMLGDATIKGFPNWFNAFAQQTISGTPIPKQLVLLLVSALLFGVFLRRTSLGRYLYGIGQNEVACGFSGVPVERVKFLVFGLNGLIAALAGIIIVSRYGSVRLDIATGYELDVITAVVLGGVDIFGGVGTITGVMLALFLLGTVHFGMSLINIQGQVQSIVVGLLLILAVLLPGLLRRLRRTRTGVSAHRSAEISSAESSKVGKPGAPGS